MSELADIKHDWTFAIVVFVIVMVLFVVSGFLLTAGRGLDDPSFKERFSLYTALGGAGLVFILGIALFNFTNRKRFIRPILHEPEDSVFRGVKVFSNPLLLFLLCLIVFSLPLFFVGKFSMTFFSGIPVFAQQITKTSSVLADSLFPALAENLFIFIPLVLVYSLVYKWFRSNKPLFWFFNLVIVPVVFGFLWYFFHLAVYGSNEVALLSVFVFGFVGIFLSMITLSFIPFFLLHFLLNFVLSLKRHGLLSSDWVVALFVALWVFAIFVFIVMYRLDKKRYGVV